MLPRLLRMPRQKPEAAASALLPVEAWRARERERLLAAFQALADPTRLEILRLLAGQRTAVCAGDLVERIGSSQPTVSHHLRILREAGLVTVSRAGIWRLYEARPDAAVLLAAARTATARPPGSRRG